MIRKFVAIVCVAGLAGSAYGNIQKEYFGEGGPLVDSVGGAPGVARFEIFVTEHNIIKEFGGVHLLGFSHSWAGDLVITVTHKDTNKTVTLLDRPGVPQSTFGDSADFDGGDYWWMDGGFVYDADIFGATVTEHNLGPVAGSLSDFVGQDKYGVWSLQIVDHAGGDTGGLMQGWSIAMFNVPGPGSIALLAAAGLLGRRRRRR